MIVFLQLAENLVRFYLPTHNINDNLTKCQSHKVKGQTLFRLSNMKRRLDLDDYRMYLVANLNILIKTDIKPEVWT